MFIFYFKLQVSLLIWLFPFRKANFHPEWGKCHKDRSSHFLANCISYDSNLFINLHILILLFHLLNHNHVPTHGNSVCFKFFSSCNSFFLTHWGHELISVWGVKLLLALASKSKHVVLIVYNLCVLNEFKKDKRCSSHTWSKTVENEFKQFSH